MSRRQSSILSFFNSVDENNNPIKSNGVQSEPAVEPASKGLTPCKTIRSESFNDGYEGNEAPGLESCEERYQWLVNIQDAKGNSPSDEEYNPSTILIPQEQWKKFTPFEKQYWEIKQQNFDSVVFFKKGKFYELYENDADLAASLFDLKVAERVNMKMAGVPEASFYTWAARFINAGYRVLRVDQVENSISKNIRKRTHSTTSIEDSNVIGREVTAAYTRGTISDPDLIVENDHTFCAFLHFDSPNHVDVLIADVSICIYFEDHILLERQHDLVSFVLRYKPKEFVVAKVQKKDSVSLLSTFPDIPVYYQEEQYSNCFKMMEAYFETMCIAHVIPIMKPHCLHSVNELSFSLSGQLLNVLDIVSNDPKKNTLWKKFNFTQTAGGRRKLFNWLINPLKDSDHIRNRQYHVCQCSSNAQSSGLIRKHLSGLPDVDRILVASNKTTTPDSVWSRIESSFKIMKTVTELSASIGFQVSKDVSKAIELIEAAFISCCNEHAAYSDQVLQKLMKEKMETENDLESVRMSISQILGSPTTYRHIGKEHFLLEVSSMITLPPEFLVMSRTKTHIRFWNNDLKKLAIKHDEISEQIRARQEYLDANKLQELVKLRDHFSVLLDHISYVDCILSLDQYRMTLGSYYTLPKFRHARDICVNIQDMKHPLFGDELSFVTNTINADKESNFMLLTGPNMGGKSTLMKQLALNVILAQVGAHIPASHYEAVIFENILARIGCDDNILYGKSTFLVELDEMKAILDDAAFGNPSLYIIDEFGRGTSTYDGIALASAIIPKLEYSNSLTLFATHYACIQFTLGRGVKYFMDYFFDGSKLIFKFKLKEGVCPSSFATQAAELAGIPNNIIEHSGNPKSISVSQNDNLLALKLKRLVELASLLPNLERELTN